jgi:hypothetical protein
MDFERGDHEERPESSVKRRRDERSGEDKPANRFLLLPLTAPGMPRK